MEITFSISCFGSASKASKLLTAPPLNRTKGSVCGNECIRYTSDDSCKINLKKWNETYTHIYIWQQMKGLLVKINIYSNNIFCSSSFKNLILLVSRGISFIPILDKWTCTRFMSLAFHSLFLFQQNKSDYDLKERIFAGNRILLNWADLLFYFWR